ncbi:MAG: hypothetical protein HQL75_07030 [Magnetococcales bacterium]|nr:hypothetical protein [Magnetococcales bacterium]
MCRVSINIHQSFHIFIAPALVRLGAMCSGFQWEEMRSDGTLILQAPDVTPESLSQQFWHQIYRERIYTETLPIRQALFQSFAS